MEEAARWQEEAGAGPPNHATCDCHRIDWCTCGTTSIAEDQLQPATYATTAFDTIYASKTKSGEVQELYRNLCTELNMDGDTLEEAWRAYRAAKSKAARSPEETVVLGWSPPAQWSPPGPDQPPNKPATPKTESSKSSPEAVATQGKSSTSSSNKPTTPKTESSKSSSEAVATQGELSTSSSNKPTMPKT